MHRIALLALLALAAQETPPAGTPLAWVRFPDGKTDIAGAPYHWLGDAGLELTIDVKPRAGQVLQFLWGSKDDDRSAVAIINGREVTISAGGYKGYRWVSVPVPAGLTGERYQVTLRAGGDGRAGFFSEVRLAAFAGAAPANRPAGGTPPADLTAPAHGITVKKLPGPPGTPGGAPAFPEMQALWDRDPKPPAHPNPDPEVEAAFRLAERHGRQANEQYYRSHKFVEGWLKHADPKTGLIPRNLGVSKDFWNAEDSAADNYPFMVLTCALTDRRVFDGRMLDMLRTETKLTSRIGRIPDDFSFTKQAFAAEKPNLEAMVFGGSEYVKDGLIPLTEWLGPSPWSERAVGIIDDIWANAPIDTPYGKLPTLNVEVDGDLLQACSRLYWFTGDRKYLDWAIRLGDYYLLGNHHPTRDFTSLRLIDHGCEVVNGLCELYLAVSRVLPEKKKAYEEPIHAMCDRVLAAGRDPYGMLWVAFNPKTGEHSKGICDTWGYDYDGLYTVYLVDKTEAYREAVRFALGNLREHYTPFDWGGMDGHADSVEGAINLYNREPIPSTAEWIDIEMKDVWAAQKPDGVVEGWHGDGNAARTAIMYALMKSQGMTVQPWRQDVRLGAVRRGEWIHASLCADADWRGKVVFDRPRHKENLHLPADYPRINQFPEWLTVEADRRYSVRDEATGKERTLTGRQLQAGMAVTLKAGEEMRFSVRARPL